MSLADEPGRIRQEFLDVIEPLLVDLNLEPSAQRLVRRYLSRGSVAVNHLEDDERPFLTNLAVRQLAQVSNAIADELRNYGSRSVSVDALTSVLQSHCGVPPFCYGEAGGDDVVGESGDDATAARRFVDWAEAPTR